LEQATNDIESNQASYAVISFPAALVPKEYQNVVIARWLRSLREDNEYFGRIEKRPYFKVYDAFIKTILLRPHATVKFAVLSDDKDVVLGWCVTEGSALHYVHVHAAQRGQGIAKTLIPDNIEYITHVTSLGDKLLRSKKFTKEIQFNPFI
jgi:GNAT superfamily N-acetyltransferase